MDKEPSPVAEDKPSVLTRIYITENGDLIVTDLWENLETDLIQQGGMEIV